MTSHLGDHLHGTFPRPTGTNCLAPLALHSLKLHIHSRRACTRVFHPTNWHGLSQLFGQRLLYSCNAQAEEACRATEGKPTCECQGSKEYMETFFYGLLARSLNECKLFHSNFTFKIFDNL